jgi:hypothetical protein
MTLLFCISNKNDLFCINKPNLETIMLCDLLFLLKIHLMDILKDVLYKGSSRKEVRKDEIKQGEPLLRTCLTPRE